MRACRIIGSSGCTQLDDAVRLFYIYRARFERLGPQLKESIKAVWAPGLFWEELDWAYMGVIDGSTSSRSGDPATNS